MMSETENQITICKPRISDSKKIANLHYLMIHNELQKITPTMCQFFDLTLSKEDVEETIQEMIDDPNHDVMVALVDSKFAGFVSLWKEEYPDDLVPAPYSTIEYLEVQPEYQHLEIGQKLVEEAERIAREKKHPYLELLVWETNEKAIHLYEKNGFSPIVRRMVKKL
jgi:ribosomal protein S18 acetylase RimI-like enzyme